MSGYRHGADEGETYDWRGARVTLKTTGVETLGQLAVMEFSYPVGLSIPAHVHDGEDEMFYILAGELRAFCDDTQWTVTPGDFVFVPRDRPHGFTVVGDTPARALVIVGPPRLERQVAAGGIRVDSACPEDRALAPRGRRGGIARRRDPASAHPGPAEVEPQKRLTALAV